MSIAILSPEPVTIERKKQLNASPFDRARMEKALSGHAVTLPHGLSREEKRRFILQNQ